MNPIHRESGAVFDAEGIESDWRRCGGEYHEFLDTPTLRTGLYVLAAGATDTQSPHTQDEVYYVIEGAAHIQIANQDYPVGPGAVVFVKAGVEHRFHHIERELRLLAFFSKAGGTT